MSAKVRRSIDQAEKTIDALLVLATSDQGLTNFEYVDFSTAAEERSKAPRSISEHHLKVEADYFPLEQRVTAFCWSAWWPTSSTTPCCTTSMKDGFGFEPVSRSSVPRHFE